TLTAVIEGLEPALLGRSERLAGPRDGNAAQLSQIGCDARGVLSQGRHRTMRTPAWGRRFLVALHGVARGHSGCARARSNRRSTAPAERARTVLQSATVPDRRGR